MGDPGNLSSRFRDPVGVPPVAVVPGTCLWLLKERMLLLQHQWKSDAGIDNREARQEVEEKGGVCSNNPLNLMRSRTMVNETSPTDVVAKGERRPWSPTGLWEGGLGIGKATLGAIGGGGAITRKKERSQEEEEEEQSVAA
ncbi:hypothetical protein GW17_00044212 [Ensete ventricosum]|nr:hypothetical protein GW17_00044212 [Ensete ventricosum]